MASRTTAARLLGVAPNASARHIQAAFRKKALETHPDRGGCANQFLAVRDAADLLLRPESQPYVPPRTAAPQPSHTTDARAVAHRTIRSLDEELAAAHLEEEALEPIVRIPMPAADRDLEPLGEDLVVGLGGLQYWFHGLWGAARPLSLLVPSSPLTELLLAALAIFLSAFLIRFRRASRKSILHLCVLL